MGVSQAIMTGSPAESTTRSCPLSSYSYVNFEERNAFKLDAGSASSFSAFCPNKFKRNSKT